MTATIQTTGAVRRQVRRVIGVGVGAAIVLGAAGVGVAFATARPVAPLVPGTARLVPGDAAVTVHRGSLTAAEDAPLRSGDALTVVDGIAIVQTSAGRLYARPGTTISFDGALPRITRGDVLVDAKEQVLNTHAAKVAVDGLTRVRQGLSLEVGVYEGVANVDTVLDDMVVPQLRRVVVAGTGAASNTGTLPLAIDSADQWDRRFLGAALELDAALTARSRGLTMQLAAATDTVRQQVLTKAAGLRDLTVLADQPVGEVVVAAELARATKEVGVFAESLAERAEGASWGLIAYAQGVRELPDVIPGIYETAVPVAPTTPAVPTPELPVTVPSGPKFWVPKPTTPPASVDPSIPPTTTTTAPPEPVVVNPLGGLVNTVGGLLGGLLGP